METERAMDNKWILLKVQGHMARKKLLTMREIKFGRIYDLLTINDFCLRVNVSIIKQKTLNISKLTCFNVSIFTGRSLRT